MASDDVVVVAEFLVGVSNEVIEIQEVQELAKETIIMEHVEEEEQVEVEQVVEEEEEVLMKSLECISLQDHDYTFATEAIEVGEYYEDKKFQFNCNSAFKFYTA